MRAFFQNSRKRLGAYLAGLDGRERAVLAVVLVLHAAAIGWGLPSSDGWDNDGVAPRDFLPGLIQTFSPGKHYTYPPLHLALLAILTLPVSLAAAAGAKSFAQADLVAAFLDLRVMTAFSVAARVTAMLMSLGIVLALGELAATLARTSTRSRARLFGMAVAGIDVSLTYYAQTTNLDVPYLFWASLAMLAFARSVAADQPRGLRWAAAFAACAIATKDQAYALFLLSLPFVTGAWAMRTGDRRTLLREAAIAVGLGVALVLVLDGAPFNPTGFAARVRFLLGPASQDFAQYSKDLTGRAAAFADSWSPFPRHYPWAIAPLIALGIGLSATRPAPRARAIALLPLVAALSFTLTFNCWARRVEERFVMPQMLFVGVYAAVALDYLRERVKTQLAKIAFGLAVASTFAVGVHKSASVSAVMLRDPRYEAEAFLKEHARPGDVVEVYGRNVYLPRFPSWLTVVRVGTEPIDRRNPMPGIEEKQDAYGNIATRNPRFIVFGGGFAWRYLISEWSPVDGRVQPSIHRAGLADQDGREYFHRLFDERAGYAKALHARYESRVFPLVQMHGSLGAEVFVFQRR